RLLICHENVYHHPDGLPMLDPSYHYDKARSLSSAGCFAQAETVADIEAYPWPDAAYCDFSWLYKRIDQYPDKMVLTGMFGPFYHMACDFFGMENYFVKMYENPAVVECFTEKIVDFYIAANEKFLQGLGDRADTLYFANDFGTQLDMMVSPEAFRQFILPSVKRLTDMCHKYNKKIMFHSCGSIYRIIPDLINVGIDVLHPLQAGAVGMSAKELAQYKNDLAFVGGIDAQTFFVNSTPQQIRDEVHRVRDILGPNYVVSPSHECILPNVPIDNVRAMMEAAKD
ncbi:MAG: hypothetical protein FWF49_02600, partial [Oscillospiraceae bacterium]|nr:hypothetical protein [Oscillospiraceae bacterium]